MLTIANWNLERVKPKQKRHERIQAAISEVTADIWILTESHKDVGPKDSSTVTSMAAQDGVCWSSIWTQFPMMPLMDFVSDQNRCAAAKVIHPVYGELIIYATVLPWVGSTWKGQAWNKGKAYIAALDTYRKDWDKLQLEYPNAIHIIAGDFNQSLVDWHYYGSKLIRKELEGVMTECNMTVVTAGKNDPVAREAKPYACIDHICISTSKIEQVYSTQRWPHTDKPDKNLSDHFGIVATIECNIH